MKTIPTARLPQLQLRQMCQNRARNLAPHPSHFLRLALPWLGDVTPVRTRRLYFSEKLLDPEQPQQRD